MRCRVFGGYNRGAMTPERWSTLCQSLEALTGPALEVELAARRAEVAQWPAAVRRIGAESPWLKGVFEGRFDPRLELVGSATLQQHLEGQQRAGGAQMFELVRMLSAHLDPSFDPPDVVLEEEDNIRSAYGCGGGQAWWTRGNASQSIQFFSNASESPSAGMRSYDRWTAAGLPEGTSLVIELDDYVDGCTLVASGPCPAVLELAPAWTALVRGADVAEVRRVLQATRVPWRPPTSGVRAPVSSSPASSLPAAPLPAPSPAAPSPRAERPAVPAAPDLSALPTVLLGALFVAEDLKLVCRVVRGEGEDGPLLTTVWAGVGGPCLLGRAVTQWRGATKLASEHARERLGQLQAELGIVGAGDLYELYVVRRNPDHALYGDKEWIAALPETPLAELRLFPEYGSSPYTPFDWDWQEGWWYPYSTFRPATPAEREAHEARG